MEYNTGSRGVTAQITDNVWSDEARQAAIEARKAGQKESLDSVKGAADKPGGGGSITKQLQSARMADSDLTMKEKEQLRQGDEGRKNYASLSDKEKKQYDTDWKDAHKKTSQAQANPTAKTHTAAAQAHTKAAKSAPSNLAYHHKVMAHVHGAQAKSNPQQELPSKHVAAAAAHLNAIAKARKAGPIERQARAGGPNGGKRAESDSGQDTYLGKGFGGKLHGGKQTERR